MRARTSTIGWALAAAVALVGVPAGIAWAATGGTTASAMQERGRDQAAEHLLEAHRHHHADDNDDARAHHHGHARSALRVHGAAAIADLVGDDATVTAADAASLAAMAEEEKLAADLYAQFADLWDARVFDAVARAEDHHLAAVRALLDAYGLDDPTAEAPAGEFSDADLRALYDELLAQGSASETGALAAAARVEEIDIAELRSQDVDATVIAAVYARLEQASEQHLRAFVRELDARGETYEATVLDATEVESITGIAAP